MSDQPWEGTPYSAAAKKRSIQEARERIQEEVREEEERATLCRCERPVASLRVYLGHRPCEVCRRFMP